MEARQAKMQQAAEKRKPGRTILLTYLGGLGIAVDHVNRIIHPDRLFKILVRRGERVEQSAVALLHRAQSQVR